MAWADRRRLYQVLQNLLSNATKLTPEGGSITVGCWSEPGLAGIGVTDTGIGIPAWEQKRIFDEFARVADGEVLNQEGTGLGVALTRHLVELMQGSIQVKSRPGGGSTFSVLLPCDEAAAQDLLKSA